MFSFNLSKISNIALHYFISSLSFESPFAHFFRTLHNSMNFATTFVALFDALTSVDHTLLTKSKNPG
jgi:hypothetical protein